jgi:hypothetical protein
LAFSIKNRRLARTGAWIQEGLFLAACFFFLLFRVHPLLILESQPPVFLKGADFLKGFLTIPGGLMDWISAFFRLFWYSDLLGALFLTVCFWLVSFMTRKWIATLTEKRPIHTFHLIPAGLLLILHGHYDFRLSVTLALIVNLIFLFLFLRGAPKQRTVRAALGLVISVLLYWTTGGAFLTFAVLCGLCEISSGKRPAGGLLLLLISAVLPMLASRSVFLVAPGQAYLHNLAFENPVGFRIAAYGLHAFYPLAWAAVLLRGISGIRQPFQKIFSIGCVWKLAAGSLLLFCGTFPPAQKSLGDPMHFVYRINRFSREGNWQDILATMQNSTLTNPLLSCQTNLALYQSDMLLDRMFAYPQTEGTVGLLLNNQWCLAWPEEASDLYLKLGLVGESQHWAHEAFEIKGATSRLLKRLGTIYMLKGEFDAADRFFRTLKNVPFEGGTADNLLACNGSPTALEKNAGFMYVRSCMPVEDFISLGKPSPRELVFLLKRNPKNKMAFEYLIACHLLNGDLKEVWNRIPDFGAFTYFQIPRHVQEAMILNAMFIPHFDPNQLKKWIQPIVFKRFMEYRSILRRHQDRPDDAKQDLHAGFSDTYWYYLMFIKPASGQSENPNEYQ